MLLAAMLHALSLCAYSGKESEKLRVDSTLQVSFLTCGPGEIIYELEGHSGLRFKSDSLDIVVNWGLFDFDSPNFLYRFVKGETDYKAGWNPTDAFIGYYTHFGREIKEQKLNLTPEEASRALYLAEQNLLPENRVYRYNYVKDNCATRPLRLIERAIEDTILLGESNPEYTTFRNEMIAYHRLYPWYQFGIDLALGSGIDYRINNREAAFAPVVLWAMLESATIGTADGRKLVTESSTINAPSNGDKFTATPFFLTPLFVFWILFAIVAMITLNDIHRRKVAKWLDGLLFGIFGVAGCLIAFLVFISEHESTSPNVLILWLNPMCLLVPLLIWFRRLVGLLICYHILNLALIALMIVMIFVIGQKINAAFIPLILCDIVRSLSFIYISKWKRRKNRLSKGYYSSYSTRR